MGGALPSGQSRMFQIHCGVPWLSTEGGGRGKERKGERGRVNYMLIYIHVNEPPSHCPSFRCLQYHFCSRVRELGNEASHQLLCTKIKLSGTRHSRRVLTVRTRRFDVAKLARNGRPEEGLPEGSAEDKWEAYMYDLHSLTQLKPY